MMSGRDSVYRRLALRLLGVALGAFGFGLMALVVWHYTRGPLYGGGGTLFLIGVLCTWGGRQLIRRAHGRASPAGAESDSTAV